MPVLMPEGRQSFEDSAGAPLVGGKLYTYAAGTNTPLATYSDALGATPNTNPVILDARGEAVVFWSGAYKAKLTDASDVVIWTQDDILSTDQEVAAISLGIQALRDDLANTADPAKGDALIGVKRTDIAGSPAMTLHSYLNFDGYNVLQLGVKGDGVTDDAPRLNVLGALGVPLFIPYTSTGYKIGSAVTFSCDVYCQGVFNPDAAIAGAALPQNRFSIILPSAGFGVGRRFFGIKVQGSGALRAAGVNGIRNDCEGSIMRDCKVFTLDYGLLIRSYSITLDNCSAQLCNTNLDAYARSSITEINALTIRGGVYDSALVAAMNIGDTSWSDALAAGNSHGVHISISDGVSIDGSELRIDNASNVAISLYAEGSNTAQAIRLGGSGDGYLRDVEIGKCYFSNLDYAVRCYSGVEGFVQRPSFYTGVRRSALYLTTDIYSAEYHRGTNVGSFTQGQEVHTGFRSLPIASVTWGIVSIPHQGLIYGAQNCTTFTGQRYPGGLKQLAGSTTRMASSAAGRFYDAPSTVKAGVVAGTLFTFNTLSDCYAFNGGDQIVTVPPGAIYVRTVDYAAGTMVIDGGVTAPGAATVSQQLAVFV